MFVQLTKAFLGKPAGERIDVSEEDAKSLVAQQLAVPVTDDLITPAVSKALESAFTKFTQSLDGIINASLKAFADAQSQAKKHAVPLIFGDGNSGDPKKSFGDFCLAVARKDTGYLEKHHGSTLIQYSAKAALAEASGITGGYTVPPDFYKQLLAIVEEQAIFGSRAFVQPMASATLQFPYLHITSVQAAGTSPGRPVAQLRRRGRLYCRGSFGQWQQ